MMKQCWLLWITALVLSGCVSHNALSVFSKSDILAEHKAADNAVVYLYRADLHDLKSAFPMVFMDGQPKGALKHREFKVWSIKQGQYEMLIKAGSFWDEITAKDSWEIREKNVSLDVIAGKYYFLRLKPSTQASIMGWRDAKLELVDEETAIKEMKGYVSADENEQ